MLVSHTKKFVFTKTVKTAGTSVESYFEKYCMPEGEWQETHFRSQSVSDEGIIGLRGLRSSEAHTWYNHMPASEISALLGDEIWLNYFKFTIIRNPFDKLISLYYFKNKFAFAQPETEIERFRLWLLNNIWHNKDRTIVDRDKYLINGEVCVDFFARYETLFQDLNTVCNKLKIPFTPEKLPRFKSGLRNNNISIKEYYNSETEDLVRKLFAWELEYFSYELK